jgi:prophage DNA circulation protein
MYEFFQDFAAPIATIIAAAAAVYVTQHFAKEQARLASERLRYDLFDRRLKVFESIFEFYKAMIGWTGTPEQIAARDRFFAAYQESAFLFDKQSGIEALLKDLNDKGAKVIGFKESGKNLASHPPTYLEQFNETTRIMTTDFEVGLAKLKSAIAPYLNFHGFKSQ